MLSARSRLRFHHHLIGIIFCLGLLTPAGASAADAGFAPSTGIWFSRTAFAPGETIRIYSVVINNIYASLQGQVGFFDNSQPINAVTIGVAKNTAEEISVLWTPAAGSHTIAARFIKAVAVDEVGVERPVSLNDISAEAGLPLNVGGSPVVPGNTVLLDRPNQTAVTQNQQTLSEAGTTTGAGQTGAADTKVTVEDKGSQRVLTAPPPLTPPSAAGGGDLFAPNRAVLTQAEQAINRVTTTAGRLAAAYAESKTFIQKAGGVAAKVRIYFNKAAPYAAAVKPWWQSISDNNNPSRVVLIIMVVLVAWWILRRLFRRRRYY